MYRKEKDKLNHAFDALAPDLFSQICQAPVPMIHSEEELFSCLPQEEWKRKTSSSRIPAFAITCAAACLCLLLIISAVISPDIKNQIIIDVNPGIRIIMDQEDHVSAILAVNKDAEKITASLPETDNLETILPLLLKNLETNGYLNQPQNGMLITFSYKDKKPPETLVKNTVSGWMNKNQCQMTIIYQSAVPSRQDQKRAKEKGISTGKYHFLQKLKNKYNMPTEDLYNKKIGEILDTAEKNGIQLSEQDGVVQEGNRPPKKDPGPSDPPEDEPTIDHSSDPENTAQPEGSNEKNNKVKEKTEDDKNTAKISPDKKQKASDTKTIKNTSSGNNSSDKEKNSSAGKNKTEKKKVKKNAAKKPKEKKAKKEKKKKPADNSGNNKGGNKPAKADQEESEEEAPEADTEEPGDADIPDNAEKGNAAGKKDLT